MGTEYGFSLRAAAFGSNWFLKAASDFTTVELLRNVLGRGMLALGGLLCYNQLNYSVGVMD